MRYLVTWNGQYLFHCYGHNETDALCEARAIARRTMRDAVVRSLRVDLDPQ